MGRAPSVPDGIVGVGPRSSHLILRIVGIRVARVGVDGAVRGRPAGRGRGDGGAVEGGDGEGGRVGEGGNGGRAGATIRVIVVVVVVTSVAGDGEQTERGGARDVRGRHGDRLDAVGHVCRVCGGVVGGWGLGEGWVGLINGNGSTDQKRAGIEANKERTRR